MNTKTNKLAHSKAVNFVRNHISRIHASVMGFVSAVAVCTCVAYASAETTIDNSMKPIINILLRVAFWGGVVLAGFGLIEIAMSFIQQQPDAKTRGIFMAAAGVVMISLRALLRIIAPGAV